MVLVTIFLAAVPKLVGMVKKEVEKGPKNEKLGANIFKVSCLSNASLTITKLTYLLVHGQHSLPGAEAARHYSNGEWGK